MNDWVELTRRIARSVQTTVGWIFWDPGAVERYAALGVPAPLGYIAARSAPLAGAGTEAVIAAFGSISPFGIRMAFELLGGHERFRQVPRPADPLLSAWHAVNCLREWRGDTHWALVVAEGLTHPEASILHNAWLDYEPDWLAKSRGTSPDDLAAGWSALETRGLAAGHEVLVEGIGVRQRLEDQTDLCTTLPWQLLGTERTTELADRLEPPCRLLLARVDVTAGPNYQPASRVRPSSAPGNGSRCR